MRGRVSRLESRLNFLLARPGYAGRRGQLAMRGRHVAELSSALRHAMNAVVSRRSRHHALLRRALTQFDPRHRLAAVRTRLVARDGQLAHAASRRLHTADARFKSLAARLDGLSPLTVLARGYAVAWDASRSRIIRDASTVTPGEEILVRVERGEIRSTVRITET
jgi:exodeoxyribonuclease VII large subunit